MLVLLKRNEGERKQNPMRSGDHGLVKLQQIMKNMKFHNVHGSSISLLENRTIATRSDSDFCNGIVFVDQPIKSGHKVCIELTCASSWSGALRVGVTSNDPAKIKSPDLPKYALPLLSKKEGYWIRPISENLVCDGVQLIFYISPAGYLQFFVNNEHKGALLSGLPVEKNLWILFDLYGNTQSARYVQSGKILTIFKPMEFSIKLYI